MLYENCLRKDRGYFARRRERSHIGIVKKCHHSILVIILLLETNYFRVKIHHLWSCSLRQLFRIILIAYFDLLSLDHYLQVSIFLRIYLSLLFFQILHFHFCFLRPWYGSVQFIYRLTHTLIVLFPLRSQDSLNGDNIDDILQGKEMITSATTLMIIPIDTELKRWFTLGVG